MERKKKYIEIRKEAREAANGDSGECFQNDEINQLHLAV